MAEILDLKDHSEDDKPKERSPLEVSNLGELETQGGRTRVEVAEDTYQKNVDGVTYYLCRQHVEGKGNIYFFSTESNRFDRVALPDEYEVDGLKIRKKQLIRVR